jgi:serine/threonine-protein kinase
MSTRRCEASLKFCGVLALAACLLVPLGASAQEGNPDAARPLFSEARELMKSGRYDAACPKLEAASKLYASAGILLNLADCYEHTNRLASAWVTFGKTADISTKTGRADDAAEANRRRALLEPRLSRMTLHVAKSDGPDFAITLDGNTLNRTQWTDAIPVDPGDHQVAASATGFVPWSTTATVRDPGKTVVVDVPELKPAPAGPPPVGPGASSTAPAPGPTESAQPAGGTQPALTASDDTSPTRGKTQRIVGLVLGGTGVVALGAGGVVGLVAKSQYNSAQNEGAGRHADSESAVNTGNVATAVVIAGGVLAAAGVVVWLTAPKSNTQIGSDGRQLLVAGHF